MPARTTTRLSSWLGYFAAVLAVVAQLAVVVAPIAEGREGVGAPAHVEAAGTHLHYSHNETTCAACQARLLHGTVVLAPAPMAAPALHAFDGDAPAPLVATYDPARQYLSRAPPV
ncbi:MAG TPA: hypothetical protein VJU87_13305 [Gemmatimonadaceae bacterium]|nr:hypothetical protein [Gemmatimonadaceae bacterium]